MTPVRTLALIAAIAGGTALLTGCGGTTVNRTDANAVRDLSGNWNAADSNEVAQVMCKMITDDEWYAEFLAKNNRKPSVRVGKVVPRSQDGEFIDTRVFTADIERALLRTRKVEVVASQEEALENRDERKDQAANADPTTIKADRQETGADMLLTGDIRTQNDQEGREKQKAYFINLELRDIRTNKKVQVFNHRITKDINRDKYK